MKIVSNKPTITRKELEGVLDCLINEELTAGNSVKTFESTVSNLVGQKYSLATNSETSAYHLIFHALQLEDGDEIVLPSYINNAVLSAISLTRAKAILVDCDENSLFPSIEQIKNSISEKTKAIVVSHTFGYHFDLEEIKEFKIPIIEDISDAIGTENNSEPIGKHSAFTILSFSPTKIITTGNGGMVLTNNSKYFSFMKELRNPKTKLGLDYTMTEFQGAMGISQLSKLKSFIKRRREIAKVYYDAAKITSHKTFFNYNEDFAYQSFPIIFDAPAEKVQKFWKKNGIEISFPIEKPLHSLLEIRGIKFPNADRLSKKIYSLPIYPTLTKKEIDLIAKTISKFL